MLPQCAFKNVCQEVGRCGTGGKARRLQDAPNRRPSHAVPHVLQRALDPGVAPRRILLRHPHDQAPDLEEDVPPAAWPTVRPFPRNQPAIPPQQRVRRRNRGDLPEGRAADAERTGGQPAAIVVRQAQAPGPSWRRRSRFSSIR